MKQGNLVRITNVVEADECINFLLNRPKLEMVGLGLIYGRPGLGKTTYASRIAYSRGYIYLRLEATTTPKAFSVELLTALYRRFNLGEYIPNGTTNNLFKLSMQILEDHEDTVIVIDEIDYAFRHDKLLGAIRDIVDETLTVVILVGMQNAKDRLAQINEYYFDRCNSFYEFQSVTKKDIKLIAREVMEIEATEQIVDDIHRHCKGNLRKAMKMMHMLETEQMRRPQPKIINLQEAR
jgi:replication-associated recombination protein RarA